jgi:hypothetical protein
MTRRLTHEPGRQNVVTRDGLATPILPQHAAT